MSIQDEWPEGPDGVPFDGLHLWDLIQRRESPFYQQWDVGLLVKEVEENTASKVKNIPLVSCGANHYGFHIEMHNYPDVLARVARGDVNMPDFDGFPLEKQVPDVQFEAVVYGLLRDSPGVPVPRLIHHRLPARAETASLRQPSDIKGRRVMLFQKEKDCRIVWRDLNKLQQDAIITQAGQIRASLFHFELSEQISQEWFLERLFEQKPECFSVPVTSTREFCIHLFTSKINATLRNVGDMIGWESDNVKVGPIAAAAKESLLRLVPLILPTDDGSRGLYRLVLEHGDFGIHNMTIAIDPSSHLPAITSLYDWETGCIAPALLSDPQMSTIVDLGTGPDASASVTRVRADATAAELETYAQWGRLYVNTLFKNASDYKEAIVAGADARHLWFALRDWRGQDPEGYFGALGDWAEAKLKEMSVE